MDGEAGQQMLTVDSKGSVTAWNVERRRSERVLVFRHGSKPPHNPCFDPGGTLHGNRTPLVCTARLTQDVHLRTWNRGPQTSSPGKCKPCIGGVAAAGECSPEHDVDEHHIQTMAPFKLSNVAAHRGLLANHG